MRDGKKTFFFFFFLKSTDLQDQRDIWKPSQAWTPICVCSRGLLAPTSHLRRMGIIQDRGTVIRGVWIPWGQDFSIGEGRDGLRVEGVTVRCKSLLAFAENRCPAAQWGSSGFSWLSFSRICLQQIPHTRLKRSRFFVSHQPVTNVNISDTFLVRALPALQSFISVWFLFGLQRQFFGKRNKLEYN